MTESFTKQKQMISKALLRRTIHPQKFITFGQELVISYKYKRIQGCGQKKFGCLVLVTNVAWAGNLRALKINSSVSIDQRKKLSFAMPKMPHISAKPNPVRTTTIVIDFRLMDLQQKNTYISIKRKVRNKCQKGRA